MFLILMKLMLSTSLKSCVYNYDTLVEQHLYYILFSNAWNVKYALKGYFKQGFVNQILDFITI